MAVKKAAPATNRVAFGNLDMYAAGGGLPEGDYVLVSLDVQMFAGFSEVKRGPERLGVMITLQSLSDPNEAERKQFYSLGSNADKSFAPDPDNGKGIVAIPGAAATKFSQQTNWNIFLKSLYDAGLPLDVFIDDVSVLEGTHVHMMNVPEPAERAGYQSKTGEAETERKGGTIAVVSEIKDDGKPWEKDSKPAAAPAAKATAKPAAKKAAPAPEPEAADGEEEANIRAAAEIGVSSVIEKYPKGTTKIQLRMGTFSAVKASQGDDMAQAVVETFFGSDDAVEGLISQFGYTVKGVQVVPA